MDLLDSILSGMEKPPVVKRPQIQDKDKREKFEKMRKERQEAIKKQKETLEKFRAYIVAKVKKFVLEPTNDDPKTKRLELRPMSKIFRSIVYETCEEHGEETVVHSFGTEEVDRHCVIFKRGHEPKDEELHAMKLGVEYKKKRDADDDDEQDYDEPRTSSKTADGKDKCREKYEKIIGENSHGLNSAKIAQPAEQYGYVPIELKKDQRTVEQVMDGIRKSKKTRLEKASYGDASEL